MNVQVIIAEDVVEACRNFLVGSAWSSTQTSRLSDDNPDEPFEPRSSALRPSWIAAATAYANHGVHMIPFFIFYSMFGFQRIGDLIWLAGDIRARGFLIGATSGRTTLAGERPAA